MMFCRLPCRACVSVIAILLILLSSLLCCVCQSKVEVISSEVGGGDDDQDEDEDIERGVLLRPYEHDKRMLARMRQASRVMPNTLQQCQLAHLNEAVASLSSVLFAAGILSLLGCRILSAGGAERFTFRSTCLTCFPLWCSRLRTRRSVPMHRSLLVGGGSLEVCRGAVGADQSVLRPGSWTFGYP